MKVKMIFGLIACALLAYGVLSLFGMYRGAMTVFELVPGGLLTVVYFMAFRAAVLRNEHPAEVTCVRVVEWQEEERETAAVAA